MMNIEELGKKIEKIESDPLHPLNGILGVTYEDVVSTDFNNDERSCILDGNASIILNPTFVKLVAYYDNEWAYTVRTVELMTFINRTIQSPQKA